MSSNYDLTVGLIDLDIHLLIRQRSIENLLEAFRTVHPMSMNPIPGPIGSGRIRPPDEIRVAEQLTDPTVKS